MGWKKHALEAAVGGTAGLAVVAIYIIARANADGADGGDWLAFAGVILGIGGSVATAMGLTAWNEHRTDVLARNRLIAAVDNMSKYLTFEGCDNVPRARGRYERIIHDRSQFQDALRDVTTRQFDLTAMARGFELNNEMIDRYWADWDQQDLAELKSKMARPIFRFQRSLPKFRFLARSRHHTKEQFRAVHEQSPKSPSSSEDAESTS